MLEAVDRDRLQETHEKSMKWTKAENGKFEYSHSRALPNDVAQEALDYINTLTKVYPFQIRQYLAEPLWDRFAQEWCETGDKKAALRKI